MVVVSSGPSAAHICDARTIDLSWVLSVWVGSVHRAFYALSRQIGLRGEHDRHGPRLHDFRHRFATRTLVRWYRSEKEPERLLPVLSA